MNPPAILLTTLNATYSHASLGLRYLLANMGDLRPRTFLCEFTIARPAQEIVDQLLLMLDRSGSGLHIIGFGVYIWNVAQTTAVVRLLKVARPDIKVILGGPEVSHETGQQEIVQLADHVITGWGDLSFAALCRTLLYATAPASRVIKGEQPRLDQIRMPYAEYSAADLAHRVVYVEASRGCPFSCEFCLSALDKTAWAFDLDMFLAEMKSLYQRGARHFKFVDRTFNLKADASIRILQFFLDCTTDDLFVHFEVVPDHLPPPLKEMIVRFPPGVLQFEVGIQSFNIEVQQRISRRQDNEQAEANLRWLVKQSNAHVHADLILGLPGETLESFATGFDRLLGMGPHEIQLGILKRLRGTPIIRHTVEYGMIFDTAPPYLVRETSAIDATTMQRVSHFARYWDVVANSGKFRQTTRLLLVDCLTVGPDAETRPSPFNAFLQFSDWLWQRTGKTSALTPESLVDALFDYLCLECGLPTPDVRQALLSDYAGSGARGNPLALRGLVSSSHPPLRQLRARSRRQEHHRSAQ
jgi:hypothetical protein